MSIIYMPIEHNHDGQGSFYRFGQNGHKYYYKTNNKLSQKLARKNAIIQGRAIEISKRRKTMTNSKRTY